jgi:hypothetical protein
MNRASGPGARMSKRSAVGSLSAPLDTAFLAEDFGDAIDVARDDVTSEFVTDPERPLEIDARARLPIAQRRAGQGFRRDINVEPRPRPPAPPLPPRSGTARNRRSTPRSRWSAGSYRVSIRIPPQAVPDEADTTVPRSSQAL